jgi:cytochrome c biogenesis protein ResB
MWKLLNSRKAAVYLLCLFLGVLLASAFVPSPYTLDPQQWQELEKRGGGLFWVYSHLSTPFIVSNPFFALISLLLFLSTLVCTFDRARKWWLARSYEFSKETAFSFAVQANSGKTVAALQGEVESLLASGRWNSSVQREGGRVTISGDKGMSGFWGSMVFHVGLLVCFLTAPVTLLTGYKGQLTLLEDDPVAIGKVVTLHEGSRGGDLIDNARVTVSSVRGEYFKGKFRYDFGGTFTIENGSDRLQHPFAVNNAVNYRGFQFSLDSFGYAPHLVIKGDQLAVDNYLNISGEDKANYFDVAKDLRAFVLFFPDFIREGGKVGTRSKNLVNPVTMVKLYRGGREVFKGLFKPGEQVAWEGRVVSVPDVKHWVSFSVAREYGIVLVMIGFVLVVSGLFVRFLSNERRIEFEIEGLPEGSGCRVRGYSRYYPAFLEKEVLQIAERLK